MKRQALMMIAFCISIGLVLLLVVISTTASWTMLSWSRDHGPASMVHAQLAFTAARSSRHLLAFREKRGSFSKLSTSLYGRIHNLQQMRSSSASTSGWNMGSDLVLVDIICARDGVEYCHRDLANQGMVHISSCYQWICSARVEVDGLLELATLETVRFIRPSHAILHSRQNMDIFDRSSSSNSSFNVSEGAQALQVGLARQQFHVNGGGITIGIISDSFNCTGGASADIAAGALPTNFTILKDSNLPGCTDEGRAMMQLIYQIAPGAYQIFRSGANGTADLALAFVELADVGCDIIVDDVTYLTELFFQDGLVTQATDQVAARNVSLFSAAGNNPREQAWVDSDGFKDAGVTVNIIRNDYRVHQFGTAENGSPIFVQTLNFSNVPGSVRISFQWDQPAFSASGDPGSMSDLDIFFLFNGQVVFGSIDQNLASDPVEVTTFDPSTLNQTGDVVSLDLIIALYQGPPPGYMEMISFAPVTFQYPSPAGTIFGHTNGANTAAVGAANVAMTPAFGVSPPVIESFSGYGGIPILFSPNGTRLSAPEIRMQPRFVGPDNVTTTFFDTEYPDGSFRFSGTSASSPQVAAVAALLLEATRLSLTPDLVYLAMESTAVEMDDPSTPDLDVGFNFATGYGLVDALAALENVTAGFTTAPVTAPSEAPVTVPPTTAAPSTRPPLTAVPATNSPSQAPQPPPTQAPFPAPTKAPVSPPTTGPTEAPTKAPTPAPTKAPTASPTQAPVPAPTVDPTQAPVQTPTRVPTPIPTGAPVSSPTQSPTGVPPVSSPSPTAFPTTSAPTATPTTSSTTAATTAGPSDTPSAAPTVVPSTSPTRLPSFLPTVGPSVRPSEVPSAPPSVVPTVGPSKMPTWAPSALRLSAQPSLRGSGLTLSPSPSSTSGKKGMMMMMMKSKKKSDKKKSKKSMMMMMSSSGGGMMMMMGQDSGKGSVEGGMMSGKGGDSSSRSSSSSTTTGRPTGSSTSGATSRASPNDGDRGSALGRPLRLRVHQGIEWAVPAV